MYVATASASNFDCCSVETCLVILLGERVEAVRSTVCDHLSDMLGT
jgi:hypothetical protein